MMRAFPDPKKLKVSKKGSISLTEDQVSWFCEFLHCTDFNIKYQHKMISTFICGSLKAYLDKEKANGNSKSNNSKAKCRS